MMRKIFRFNIFITFFLRIKNLFLKKTFYEKIFFYFSFFSVIYSPNLYYFSLFCYFTVIFLHFYNDIKILLYKGKGHYLLLLFSIFFNLFNIIVYGIVYFDLHLAIVIDATENVSDDGSEDDYRTETMNLDILDEPRMVEKIYHSNGIKVQENHYENVVIDGVQKKQISKSFYYDSRTGHLKKAVSYKDNDSIAVYKSRHYKRYSS
jgi:hypothetical protein